MHLAGQMVTAPEGEVAAWVYRQLDFGNRSMPLNLDTAIARWHKIRRQSVRLIS
jgi:hypothetical protein